MIGKNEGIYAPGAQDSPMIFAPNATNSPITINQSQQVETQIENVKKEFSKFAGQLPADERAAAELHLKNLEAAAKSKERAWYTCSAEGLLKASKFVKDFTGNIFGTVGQLGKLLWPDFELPKTESAKSTAKVE